MKRCACGEIASTFSIGSLYLCDNCGGEREAPLVVKTRKKREVRETEAERMQRDTLMRWELEAMAEEA